jgi:hypothetical protein
MIEYPCPECGSDGPHNTHEEPDGEIVAVCICQNVFEIPPELIVES